MAQLSFPPQSLRPQYTFTSPPMSWTFLANTSCNFMVEKLHVVFACNPPTLSRLTETHFLGLGLPRSLKKVF